MLKKYFVVKFFSPVLILLLTGVFFTGYMAFAQQEEKMSAEYAKIKEKIAELEKMTREYGKSPELEAKIQELKLTSENMEKGLKEKEKALSKELLEIKNKRIKDKEDKLQLSLMSSEKLQDIERAASIRTVPELAFHYYNCMSILENNIDVCSSIQDTLEADNCKSQFRLFKLFDELTREKSVTNKALRICKEEFKGEVRAVDNYCKIICNAYVTGEAPNLSNYYQGEELSFMLALLTGDEKYCNSIGRYASKADCLGNARVGSAIKKQDAAICESIDNAVLRTSCRVYFSKKEETCKDCISSLMAERRKK